MVLFDICDALVTPAVESLSSSPAASRPIRTVGCLMTSDVLAIVVAMLTASALRDLLLHSPLSADVSAQTLAALLLSLCSFTAAGLYPGITINPVEELRRSTLAVTLAFLALWSATLFLHDLGKSRLIYVIGYLLAVYASSHSFAQPFAGCLQQRAGGVARWPFLVTGLLENRSTMP